MAVVIGAGAGYYNWQQQASSPSNEAVQEKIHYHTGFLVLQDGEQLDLTSDEFMYFKPCGLDEGLVEATPNDRVHLHNGIGDVLHIHDDPVALEELLISLKLDTTLPWQVYNETGTELDLSAPIPDTESIVYSTTPLTTEEIEALDWPTEEHITTIENDTFENCGA